MAPEYLAHGIFTKASEVYSLGVILWELSAGRPPFAGEDFNTLRRQIVQDNRRETPLPNTPAWYIELYQWCWHPDPAYRPTARMVKNIIGQDKDLEKDPGIRDHPAISKWISLSLSEDERRKQLQNTPWPGRLYPPPLYDRDMFTSKAFKTLDAEAAEAAHSRSLTSKFRSLNPQQAQHSLIYNVWSRTIQRPQDARALSILRSQDARTLTIGGSRDTRALSTQGSRDVRTILV